MQQPTSTQLAPQTTNITDDALVERRLTGLLSQDSPYMQQAETQGNQQAQGRGLLSSSLAVGAVEGERIRAALPIAQQDAQTFGNRDLQDGAYVQQGNLNNQAFGQQQVLNDQSFGHNQQLADQSFGHNRQLNDQTFGHNRQLSDQSFNQNQQLNDQGFGHQQQLNTQQNTAQASLQQDNQVATIRLNASNSIAAIEANPNLSPQQRDIAIQNTVNLQNAQIEATRRGTQLSQTSFIYPPRSGQSRQSIRRSGDSRQ